MSHPNPSVAVIGSLNIDFCTRTRRIPSAGETAPALSFHRGFGGKGANQAVACARLSSSSSSSSSPGPKISTLMIGQLGDDVFGDEFIPKLRDEEGIDVSGLRQLKGKQTGVTNIIVEEEAGGGGENRIMVVAYANEEFAEEYDPGWELLPEDREGLEVVVFQLEIPKRVVLHNMRRAREAGKHVVFNPSPAQEIPEGAYADVDTLVVNESEAGILSGREGGGDGVEGGGDGGDEEEKMLGLGRRFMERGVRKAVIITLGGKGLVYVTSEHGEGKVPAIKVKAVDTTAAGDTFVGAYAVELARQKGGLDFRKAMEFATLAASKTVQKSGSMSSIPFARDL